MSQKFTVRHDLDQLSIPERVQYLRDASVFIGLDPDLNGLDLIKMRNETSPGYSLVVYAKRGTAEILRNIYEVEVETLTETIVNGSIVYAATGRSKARGNRQEIAIGSKYIQGLTGKDLDDAIMTASTRALRRLTMQFTTLGILDESEVVAILGQSPNPAGSVQLAPDNAPPMFQTPTVPANNAPGKVIVEQVIDHVNETITETTVKPLGEPFVGQKHLIDEAMAQVTAKQSAKIPAPEPAPEPVTPAAAPVTNDLEPAPKADKPKRKPRKTVSLEVEPETVTKSASADIPKSQREPIPSAANVENKLREQFPAETKIETTPAPEPPSAPTPSEAIAPAPVASAAGLPSPEQMNDYRTKIGAFTKELPPSNGLGSVQKMRAFITNQSGKAPQDMTVVEWEKIVLWFQDFSTRNGIKGLVKYINDTLGVK